MSRDRRRRRSGGGSFDPAVIPTIYSSIYEAVGPFQSKMMGMKDTFRTSGADAGQEIQKAVMEMVGGILNGVRAAIPQFNPDKD